MITSWKTKIRSQLEQGIETEVVALLAFVMGRYMKYFRFMSDKMVEAHGPLKWSALGLSDIVVVQKKKPERP